MRDLALTIVVFGLLPFCLMRPWIGVLTWYWLGIMNPHKQAFGFAVGFPFAMLVAAVTLAGLLMTRDRKGIPWDGPLTLMLLFFGYVTMTTFTAWAPDAAWVQWDKVMKIVLMTGVTTMLIHGQGRIRWLLLVAALSIGFYGVKGGIFTLTSGGVYRVEGPDGTFIAGNTFLGLALVMVLPLLIYLAREEMRPWLRKILYITAALTLLSAVFTYSRGALVGLALVIPLLFLKSKKKFLVILIAIPLIYFGKDLVPEQLYKRTQTIETYEEDHSSMQRVRAWWVAWNIAKDNPLTGAGFEFEYSPRVDRWFSYMPSEYRRFGESTHSAHSIYFQVLGQHGFVAFTLFIGMILWCLLRLRQIREIARKSPEMLWIANYADGLQVGLVGYLACGAFLSSAYFDMMYLFVALSAIMGRELASAQIAQKAAAKRAKAMRLDARGAAG